MDDESWALPRLQYMAALWMYDSQVYKIVSFCKMALSSTSTTVEPLNTDPGLVGPLPFTALKTLTDLALLYSLY